MNPSAWNEIFETLATPGEHHIPGSAAYVKLKQEARALAERNFAGETPEPVDFGPLGALVFPYFKMGNVNSLNLFDLDELIIFAFYWKNRRTYRRALDIGANIGLHSVILSKCGYEVRCFEPDPVHVARIHENLDWNGSRNVEVNQLAVSSKAGEAEFVRVVGNTTGNHLAGSKPNPYGKLDRFPVRLAAFGPLLAWTDLVKLDVEGHEKIILEATNRDDWRGKDALVEIENENNAAAVYEHFKKMGVNLYSQKTGWQRINDISSMPTSYHDGTLFISEKERMPW